MPKYDSDYLLLAHNIALMKVPLAADGSNKGQPLVIRSMQTAVGLDIDCLNGKVSEIEKDIIWNLIEVLKFLDLLDGRGWPSDFAFQL